MHIIAAIIAALLLVPAAIAGIGHGLTRCHHHLEQLTSAFGELLPILEALTPFGTGVLMIISGLGVLVLFVLATIRSF